MYLPPAEIDLLRSAKVDMSSYELIDSGHFRKLERFGNVVLDRPCAQAVWKPKLKQEKWQGAAAKFLRKSGGQGRWQIQSKSFPASWKVDIHGLNVLIKLTEFGHVGIFPEHHDAPLLEKVMATEVEQRGSFKLLNLFAYTGVVSLLGARSGAHVTHIDASKTSVSWARENAALSGLEDCPVRWIVEDVGRFVGRAVSRGDRYDGIVLDPPSFGRGPKGDVWKIEDHLLDLLDQLKVLASENFAFIKLSAHSQGYTPVALENLLRDLFPVGDYSHHSREMIIRPNSSSPVLPAGASALCLSKKIEQAIGSRDW